MRLTLFAVCLLLTLVCAPAAVAADSWAFVYGGVDSIKNSPNSWSFSGNSAEVAVFNQDTGEGNGHRAMKLADSLTYSSSPYYSKSLPSGHVALIFTMRFKLLGGAPTTGNPMYTRVRYNDCRSGLYRRSNVPAESGGTGDDFFDLDITNDTLVAPYDEDWHTYTLIMVGAGYANSGSKAYFDGILSGTRNPGLTGNSYDLRVGIMTAPTTDWPDAELWVDYLAYGYDDTPDELGNYGWDISNMPTLNPDHPLVPEPTSWLTLGSGLAMALGMLRRRFPR